MQSDSQILISWSGPILAGALTTIEMTLAAYTIALILGVVGALAKLGGIRVVQVLVTAYTLVMRAVPELVLIIFLFYAGQHLLDKIFAWLGVTTSANFSPFWTAVVVLAIVDGAYLAEIFRGSIQAIPRGHIEAADAYGMSRWLRFRRIILFEMLPTALPSMYNIFLILIKDTALVSVVGAQELFFTTEQAAASTNAYFLLYSAEGLLYLSMTMGSNLVFRWLEHRFGHARLSSKSV